MKQGLEIEMKLEEGRKYVCRNGSIIELELAVSSEPLYICRENGMMYGDCGPDATFVVPGKLSPEDIVCEYMK